MLHNRTVRIAVLLFLALGLLPASVLAQTPQRPFTLPFNVPPGPGTWLLGQQYGNTSGAYNFGKYWYAAGQGLHFGIDFNAPCGTPVVAIADGVIDQVDNFSVGLLPHNVTIFHRQLGLTSLYGHLYAKPTVVRGQPVSRGDVIALSGDPDRTCVSRPHLHLEVRSRDYTIAHNPAPLIDADWTMLESIGSYGSVAFVKDLYYPNRWQTIYDQPDVDFNEAKLNNYTAAWPPAARNQPAPQTLPGFVAPALTDSAPTYRRLTEPGCCSLPWWSPDSHSVRYWDGPPGQRASIMAVGLDGGAPQPIDSSPVVSPDGQSEVRYDAGRVSVVRLADKSSQSLMTGGAWPIFSPGSTRILWQWSGGDIVPGVSPPQTEIWVANPDGSDLLSVMKQPGVSANWLDDDRLLVSKRQGLTNVWTLSVYTISPRQLQPLFTGTNVRAVSISPGGKYLLFYMVFQDDRATSGIYLLETRAGAAPIKMPFFGSWGWRDGQSVLYIPYEMGKPMRFVAYDVATGQSRALTDPATQPIAILNDDWAISPDGRRVVFWNAKDSSLWLMTLPG